MSKHADDELEALFAGRTHHRAILIGMVDFIRTWVVAIGAGIAAIGTGVVLALRTERGVYTKDQLLLKLPIFGAIVLSAILNRFARTLAMVLKAGVPLGQTFDAVIGGTGNKVFQRGLLTVKEQMTSGEGFAGPLIRTHLFPPMMTQMVRVGEETGTLDTYLEQAADFYEEELEYRIRAMTSLIEPVRKPISPGPMLSISTRFGVNTPTRSTSWAALVPIMRMRWPFLRWPSTTRKSTTTPK